MNICPSSITQNPYHPLSMIEKPSVRLKGNMCYDEIKYTQDSVDSQVKSESLFQAILGRDGTDIQIEMLRWFDFGDFCHLKATSKAALAIPLTAISELWSKHYINLNVRFLNNLKNTKNFFHISTFKDFFSNLNELSIVDKAEEFRVHIENIECIRQLTKLKKLHLSGLPNEFITSVTNLTHLKTLSLTSCSVNENSFIDICKMTNLDGLHLKRNEGGIINFNYLSSLDLLHLSLEGGDNNPKFLTGMTKLTYLSHEYSPFSSDYLKGLTNLQYLSCFSVLSDVVLNLPGLEYLNVVSLSTEEAEKYLKATQLKTLNLTDYNSWISSPLQDLLGKLGESEHLQIIRNVSSSEPSVQDYSEDSSD